MNLYFQNDLHSHLIRYSISLAAAIGLHSPALADHHEQPVDLAGIWNATASSDAGDESKIVWTIEKNGDKYTGTSVDSASGEERKLDRISVEEKKVTIEVDVEMDGVKGLIKVVAEEKEANKLTGKWHVSDADGNESISGAISAEKDFAVAFAGEWRATSVLPDGSELGSTLILSDPTAELKGRFLSAEGDELEIGKDGYTGSSTSSDGTARELSTVKLEEPGFLMWR